MTLDEFLVIYEADNNEWWRAGSGDHQNWFEEAVDRWRAALAEVGEWREENRVLVAAVESLNRKLRAALAARPEPIFEGTLLKLEVWLNSQDAERFPLEYEVAVLPAGSAAPTDNERDARFATGNDAVWGPGNWIRCPTCPRDHEGREVYHHKDAHSTTPPETTMSDYPPIDHLKVLRYAGFEWAADEIVALRTALAARSQSDKPQAEDALFKGTLSQLRSRLDGVYLPGTEWHPDTLVMVYVEAVVGSATPGRGPCGLCGANPTRGYASATYEGRTIWLCHPERNDPPDCYRYWLAGARPVTSDEFEVGDE